MQPLSYNVMLRSQAFLTCLDYAEHRVVQLGGLSNLLHKNTLSDEVRSNVFKRDYLERKKIAEAHEDDVTPEDTDALEQCKLHARIYKKIIHHGANRTRHEIFVNQDHLYLCRYDFKELKSEEINAKKFFTRHGYKFGAIDPYTFCEKHGIPAVMVNFDHIKASIDSKEIQCFQRETELKNFRQNYTDASVWLSEHISPSSPATRRILQRMERQIKKVDMFTHHLDTAKPKIRLIDPNNTTDPYAIGKRLHLQDLGLISPSSRGAPTGP
jgi:hypothetical protein